jgi:mono/diheme cytochrome c family protein
VNRSPFLIFAGFAAVCLFVVFQVVKGQGAEGAAPVAVASEDKESKELFATACGPCHTLAAAGADGVVGPNLDQVLAPGGTSTYEGSYQRAITAVTCGFGEGRMPAGILQGENAEEVSEFVAAYAGQAGSESEPLEPSEDAPDPVTPDCGEQDAAEDSGEPADAG